MNNQTQENDDCTIILHNPENANLALKEGIKGTMNLFSEYGEAIQFAKSLGKSFLMIVPADFDEQTLFENLKEIYGRRLVDFEEEHILKEDAFKLFKVLSFGHVKILKVRFWARRI